MGQYSNNNIRLPANCKWKVSHFQLSMEICKNLRKQTVGYRHIAASLGTL